MPLDLPQFRPIPETDDAPPQNHHEHQDGADDRDDAYQDQDRAERIYADPGMDVDHVDTQVIADEDAEYMHLFSLIDRDDMIRTHEDIAKTIHMIGGDMRKYRRERHTQAQVIVSEIYSAPRMTVMARRRRKYGIEPGESLELTTNDDTGQPWDFNDPRHRVRAEKLLDEQRPLLLIGSPMCAAFSGLQQIATNRPEGSNGWRDPRRWRRTKFPSRASRISGFVD